MNKVIQKIFGGISFTWPRLITFSVIMGAYTALMAMLVPDGNSFHDIAVTPEWWVFPAIIIIINSKKPLEAATKTFIFFLISQPLVYLIQVPFTQMGWGILGFYPYWFKITLLTFPAAYVCWFIKKNEWYSGVILSIVTTFLAFSCVNYVRDFIESPPNHIITIIYCIVVILLLILAAIKDKIARIIASVITVAAMLAYVLFTQAQPFEVYNNTFIKENEITFVGEPYISFWTGEGRGGVEIIEYDGGYNFKLDGDRGRAYRFTVSDDEQEYHFKYYFDDNQQTVIIERINN